MRFLSISLSIFLCLSLPSLILAQPVQWDSRGVGSGGAVYAPSINPYNPAELFISCDMSESFHSMDSGTHFTTLPFASLTGKFNSWVRFTESPSVMYTLRSSTGSYVPVKSTDGGVTWGATSYNPCIAPGAFQLYVDHTNQNRVVISDYSHIYYSHDGLTSVSNTSSLFMTSNSHGIHLAGVFFDVDTIYVCTNQGFFISHDNGATWNASPVVLSGINVLESIVSFSAARRGNTLRFFCATLNTSSNTNYSFPQTMPSEQATYPGAVYRIANYYSSTAWQTVALPSGTHHIYSVAMLPDHIDTLYLGGQKGFGSYYGGAVYTTLNGGLNWTIGFLSSMSAFNSNQNIATGWMGAATSLQYMQKWKASTTESIGIDPTNINRIIRTDKYAAYESDDLGTTWRQLQCGVAPSSVANHAPGIVFPMSDQYTTNGMESTVAWWMAWTGPQTMFEGMADILLSRSADGGNYWDFNYTGLDSVNLNDCTMLLPHPSNGVLYAATGDVPGSNGNYDDSRLSQSPGRISTTIDGGLTWQVLISFGRPVMWMELDPSDNNKMYVAVCDVPNGGRSGVWYCDNLLTGTNWVRLNEPARAQGRCVMVKVLGHDTLVTVYAARYAGSAYTASSGVFYSTDGGSTWADNVPLAMQYDTRTVTPDPADPMNTWYACVGTHGSGTKGLYVTYDHGQNWSPVNTSYSCVSLTFDQNSSNAYLCTENSGLLYVTNFASTPVFTLQNNYPFRNPYRVFFNPYNLAEVWIASFGNGFRVGLNLTTGISEVSNNSLACYPNPSKGLLQLVIPNTDQISEVTIFDLSGRKIFEDHGVWSSGIYKIDLTDHGWNAGLYFLELRSGGKRYVNKVIFEGP